MAVITTTIESNKNERQAGFSFAELLMVIVIIVIVSTLALMTIGSSKIQLSRQNVARELKSAFERARFDSVKRRATASPSPDNRANVVVNGGSFTLNTGDAGSVVTIVNSNWMTGISICDAYGATLTSPITIYFDKRGEVTTSSGSAVFLICNGDCTTPTASNSNKILVTPTGTVNLLSGAAAVPTFSPPPVTTPAIVINNDTVLP